MKKNFFKGLALTLGLVAFFNVNTFAAYNTHNNKVDATSKTQSVKLVAFFNVNTFAACNTNNNKVDATLKAQSVKTETCKFHGRYKLSDKDLKVLQENFKKEIMTNIPSSQENPPLDMNIDKVVLTIQKDGNGKLSTLWSYNICPGNDNFDAYGKICLAFNISQKDKNTFSFCFPDKSNEASLTLFRKRINGKKCLIVKDNSLVDLVFEKVN